LRRGGPPPFTWERLNEGKRGGEETCKPFCQKGVHMRVLRRGKGEKVGNESRGHEALRKPGYELGSIVQEEKKGGFQKHTNVFFRRKREKAKKK